MDVQQLLTCSIQRLREFSHPHFRCCLSADDRGKILAFAVGEPVDDEDQPRVSGGNPSATEELYGIAKQAGLTLDKVHRHGWTPRYWDSLAAQSPGLMRWGAYCSTAKRSLYCQQVGTTVFIDSFSDVCKIACDDLLARWMELAHFDEYVEMSPDDLKKALGLSLNGVHYRIKRGTLEVEKVSTKQWRVHKRYLPK